MLIVQFILSITRGEKAAPKGFFDVDGQLQWMEGLSNRMATNHLLSAQQNIAVQPHYGGIPMSQQRPERLPPSYEEAQLAAQNADIQQINNMEAEKHAIYRHPLFPLLVLLFEKCEQTTATSECPPCPAFDNEIKDYIIQHNREGKPFFTEDADLNTLIVKAIQVLRIHLLELEKVNELCKDFCQRYITCLKGKMQSENLLRSPLPASFQQTAAATLNVTVPQIPGLQPQQAAFIPQQQVTYYTTPPGNPCTVALATPNASVMGAPLQQQQQVALTYAPQAQMLPGQQLVITQAPQQTAVTQAEMAQTTVSYVAPAINTTVSAPTLVSNSMDVGSPPEITVPSTVPLPALDSPTETPEKKRTKRGVLPKQATNIMKTWLFQHLVHPYPTEDEKRAIASQTNLTILQVNNWFINARRRILQPMLDASDPDGPKAKKSKIQRFPAQRFWPETLVPNQFSNVPIAPASMAVIPAGMQVQTVQHVAGTTVALPTTVPSIVVPTSLIQTIPSSATVRHQPVPGTNMVVVTLPPNASQVTTLSETESTAAVSSHQTMITSTAASQVDSACLTSGSMPTMLVHVQDSQVPIMSHNGSVRGTESTLHLVVSPHHVATTVMQEGISTVEGLQLETGTVHTGLVN